MDKSQIATSSNRLRVNLNAEWLFKKQSYGVGELGSYERRRLTEAEIEPRFVGAECPDYDDSDWQRVDVPHCWNAHDVMSAQSGYWRGIGWYRKTFRLGEKWRGKRVSLQFEGVNQAATFWLNGRLIGSHRGGYTFFDFDVTDALVPLGDENLLTAQVDNLYDPDMPPTVKTDINFVGGIYRDVWILGTEPVYSDSVWVQTPQVSKQKAVVLCTTNLVNKTSHNTHVHVAHTICDAEGKTVCEFGSKRKLSANSQDAFEQKSPIIRKPNLWSPDDPYLYRLTTTLSDAGEIVDQTETLFGFRWFCFDPNDGFSLNGRNLKLKGTNRHQDFPGMAFAVPNFIHRLDIEIMKDMGVNFWRTSHYPHDPETLDMCDRLGILVLEEIPVMKEIGDPERYTRNAQQMAREMIRSHRNHPSIILWGIAGEIDAQEEIAAGVTKAILETFHEEDPTRQTTIHCPRSEQIEKFADVVGTDLNRSDDDHQRNPHIRYMVSEFSVSFSGRGLHDGEPFNEEDSNVAHENHLRGINERQWLAGCAIWNQFDWIGETYDMVFPHVTAFGMCDVWRLPKDVYYFYRSQWNPELMVHICGHWTWHGRENRIRTVKVYSNADRVQLLLNGVSLGLLQKPCEPNLKHPPYIWNVPYSSGCLTAVATFSDGSELIDERMTAGKPFAVRLTASPEELVAGDLDSHVMLTAEIVDRDGTVVPDAYLPVSFSNYGCGTLLAQTWLEYGTGFTWRTVAGKTRILLRATEFGGRAVITASSAGLVMGRLIVNAVDPSGRRNPFRFWRDHQTEVEEPSPLL